MAEQSDSRTARQSTDRSNSPTVRPQSAQFGKPKNKKQKTFIFNAISVFFNVKYIRIALKMKLSSFIIVFFFFFSLRKATAVSAMLPMQTSLLYPALLSSLSHFENINYSHGRGDCSRGANAHRGNFRF